MPSTYKASTYAASSVWLEESKVEYKPNPKNGKSFHRYTAYEKAKTLGEALTLGALPADLLFDFEHGLLQVSEPLREKPLDLFAVKNFDDLTYTDKVLSRYNYLADPSKKDSMDSDKIQVLEESIRKQRANMRRLRKIQIASALHIQEVDSLADNHGFWETPMMMARRSLANQQAKEILEIVQKENRKITDFEVLSVLRLWDFRENQTRLNVMQPGQTFIYSDTVGLVADRTGHIVAKEETKRYPPFGQFLCRWLQDHTPEDLGTDFVCTSININKNYAGRLHRDGSNVGPSFIKAFGEFKGGQLNYFPEDDRSLKLEVLEETHSDKAVKVDVANGLTLFDGKRGHWVDPFEGERYTLVFFTCPRYERITDETRTFMEAAGFPLPNETKMNSLLSVLRTPGGYGDAKKQAGASTRSLHDAAYLFWPHNSEERLKQEVKVWDFWQKTGMREPVVATEHHLSTRIQWEHTRHRRNVSWNEHQCLVLPSEPADKKLLLNGFKNMVDAVTFLNAPESRVPNAITKAGCCAVLSNRTRVWYALYKHGNKAGALQTFGLDTELAQPKRGKRAAAAAAEEATPPRKRKEEGSNNERSAAKTRRTNSKTTASGESTPSKPKRLIIGPGRKAAGNAAKTDAKAPAAQTRSTFASRVVKSVQKKAATAGTKAATGEKKAGTEEKKAGNRCKLQCGREEALARLVACAPYTPLEFQPNGKTAESHSGSFMRYKDYCKAKTLQGALEAGASANDLVYDIQAGFLTLQATPKSQTLSDEELSETRFGRLVLRWRKVLEG